MSLTQIPAFVLACILSCVATGISLANGAELCTSEQMETDPQSVEAPCTDLLKTAGLDPKRRAEVFYIRGRGRHRSYQIELAAQDYDQAVQLDPTNSDFYVDRANTRLSEDDLRGGMADLETSLRLDSRNLRALVSIGSVLSEQGQVAEGLQLIDKALSIDPSQPFGLLFRQHIYAGLGRWAEALADADALVALDAEKINRFGYINESGGLRDFHIVALVTRAEIHERKGDLAKAEADLDAAVAYSSILQSHLARVKFLARQPKRDKDALKDWDVIASLIPETSAVHYSRGLILARLGRPNDAVEAFTRAIESDDQNAQAYEIRGRLLASFGRFDDANTDMTKALELDPSLIGRYISNLRAAGYYRLSGTPQEMTPALKDALKACSLDPRCRRS